MYYTQEKGCFCIFHKLAVKHRVHANTWHVMEYTLKETYAAASRNGRDAFGKPDALSTKKEKTTLHVARSRILSQRCGRYYLLRDGPVERDRHVVYLAPDLARFSVSFYCQVQRAAVSVSRQSVISQCRGSVKDRGRSRTLSHARIVRT